MHYTNDGRRQVGVKDAKGEMLCGVRGQDRSTGGLRLEVCARVTCRSLWYPGVATLLGLDIALDSKDHTVIWDEDGDDKWTVTGTTGFTGFGVGPPPHMMSRQTSFDVPQPDVPERSPESNRSNRPSLLPARSTSSSASLLRAPLPGQHVPDYSFETAAGGLSVTVSSLGSTSMASTVTLDSRRSQPNSSSEDDQRPFAPSVPVTVHVNMNDLIPPNKNSIVLEVTGRIVIIPRSGQDSLYNDRAGRSADADIGPLVPLPVFRVLSSETEHMTTTVRNDADMMSVEVYNAFGDVHDPQARKTVLQRNAHTKLGVDGGRIGLRSLVSSLVTPEELSSRTPPASRPRTPSNGMRRKSSSYFRPGEVSGVSASGMATPSKPRRDGPLMISYVLSTVTPLLNASTGLPDTYAVRVSLPAPPGSDMDWLEFGLALPAPPKKSESESPSAAVSVRRTRGPPQVEVASVTVEGVPVRFETTSSSNSQNGNAVNQQTGLGVRFEETEGKEWVSWLRVHVGGGGGAVEVVYLVSDVNGVDEEQSGDMKKGKRKATEELPLQILLPIFPIPVGRVELVLEDVSGGSNLSVSFMAIY